MREIKFQFIIDKKYLSKTYSLDQIIKEGIDEQRILEEMEICDCNLNESVNCCEGDCLQFENSTITGKRQYTGLKDKNGKEIYGGDILDCWEGRCHVAKFSFGRFYFETLNDYDEEYPVDNSESRELGVIGNIHENPELLEVK